jgi:hypothetical protein
VSVPFLRLGQHQHKFIAAIARGPDPRPGRLFRRFLVRRLGRRVVVGGGRPDYDVEGSAREYDSSRLA